MSRTTGGEKCDAKGVGGRYKFKLNAIPEHNMCDEMRTTPPRMSEGH